MSCPVAVFLSSPASLSGHQQPVVFGLLSALKVRNKFQEFYNLLNFKG